MRAVRRSATGNVSVVRRPGHVHALAAGPDGGVGPGARCDHCGGEADLSRLDKGSAELCLGEFFRHHRKCAPPVRERRRRPGPDPSPAPDPAALRRRAEELLAETRARRA